MSRLGAVVGLSSRFRFLVLAIILKRIGREISQVARSPMATLHYLRKNGAEFIYGREGCALLPHAQIRFLAADVRLFGAPPRHGRSNMITRQLWGTRRIGRILSREFNLHPRDWQLAHVIILAL